MLVAGKSEGVPAKQVIFAYYMQCYCASFAYFSGHFNVLDCGQGRIILW